jgi:hypothetical protein
MHRIRIVNTSRYPSAVVRRLLAFARGSMSCGDVAVNVKNCGFSFAGRCYQGVPSLSKRKGDRLVVVRIGAPHHFPLTTRYRGLKTAPVHAYRDWQEAMVGLAAHELMHATQFETKSPCSEVEAEYAALHAVERFRAARASLDLDALEVRERTATDARAAARSAKRAPEVRREKIAADLKRWEIKAKVAETRLAKLRRTLRDHDRRVAARAAGA